MADSSSSSESEDDLMNIWKPLKRVVLPPVGRQAKEEELARKMHSQKWPPNCAAATEEPDYFVEIQRKERERMGQKLSQTIEEGSVVFPSAMSQFEVDTIGNSSVHNATISSKKPSDNLRYSVFAW